VLEVDIRKFFDTLDHRHLREILERRVRDGVILRLIGKWLKAGVMESGSYMRPESGTPQGGVISPLLANIYLHEVMDVWFEREVKPRMKGSSFLIRYADDLIIGFKLESDASRVMDILPKRFGEYGLTLHPDKTRLIDFRKPQEPEDAGKRGPGSFDLLGFTFFWAKSRKGNWVVKQRTAKSRLRIALSRIKEWCKANRHRPIGEQQQSLSQKLRGHYGYFGITGNSWQIAKFRYEVDILWRKWLSRRSQKSRMNWETFNRLLKRYPLPAPIAIHSIYCNAAKP